jgi:serine/threonine protein kinase
MFIKYMDGGCLTELVYEYMHKLDEVVISYILGEIINGLGQLHSHKRIHRDIKSDNILLNLNGDVMIADFGFATQLTMESHYRHSVVGTPAWMAPVLNIIIIP